MPEYTAEVVAVGTLRLLDAIKTCGLEKSVKFYQASTSELYGKVQEVPQNEKTPFYPRYFRYEKNLYSSGPYDGIKYWLGTKLMGLKVFVGLATNLLLLVQNIGWLGATTVLMFENI